MKTHSDSNLICCPEFDPIPWDDKTFNWENKKFIKDKVFPSIKQHAQTDEDFKNLFEDEDFKNLVK